MRFSPGFIGVAQGVEAKALTFRGSDGDDTNTDVYTFSSKAIGTASASRRVIVGVGVGSVADQVTSVTVGGVTADLFTSATSTQRRTYIAVAHVPTGTTADIVVTCSASQLNCGIGWWTATGLSSNTPVDHQFGNGTTQQGTLSTVSGGFAMAYSRNAQTSTWTWTNATERFDATIEAGSASHSGADASTSGANLTISYTLSGTPSTRSVSMASW